MGWGNRPAYQTDLCGEKQKKKKKTPKGGGGDSAPPPPDPPLGVSDEVPKNSRVSGVTEHAIKKSSWYNCDWTVRVSDCFLTTMWKLI